MENFSVIGQSNISLTFSKKKKNYGAAKFK